MRQRGGITKRILKVLGCLFVVALIVAVVKLGPLARTLYNAGVFDRDELRTYQGTSMDNLKAQHTALMLYEESEGQLPDARGWMDAIKPRLRTADLSPEEAMKKLVNPMIQPAKAGVFGYAMNDALSKKYDKDVKSPATTILIFDSKDTRWNAHGAPAKLLPKPARQGGNLELMLDGHVVKKASE